LRAAGSCQGCARVEGCQDLPGQDLLQYVDEDDKRQNVTSSDVNAYPKEISGHDITAKHFHTWAGTVLVAIALGEFEKFDTQARTKKNIKAAIERVATRLGNTPTICRKCHVHPEVLTAYLAGDQLAGPKQEVEAKLRDFADLRAEEAALLELLSRRLSRDLGKARKVA
jgi:DNA topoisomerase I